MTYTPTIRLTEGGNARLKAIYEAIEAKDWDAVAAAWNDKYNFYPVYLFRGEVSRRLRLAGAPGYLEGNMLTFLDIYLESL